MRDRQRKASKELSTFQLVRLAVVVLLVSVIVFTAAEGVLQLLGGERTDWMMLLLVGGLWVVVWLFGKAKDRSGGKARR